MKIGEIVKIGDREPAPAWQPKRTAAPVPPSQPARSPEEALARSPARLVLVLSLDRHL